MKSTALLVQLLVSTALFSYPALATDQNPTSNDVFLLQQFIKLQQEVSGLRQDINELKELVKAQAARPAAAMPSPRQDAAAGAGTLYEVSLEPGTPLLGNEEAQIVIVEFTDFECPYCAKFHNQTFKQLRARYIESGKVRYAVRNLPLDFHPSAKRAAVASNCAGEQGKFWEMQDQLFTNQKQLGEDLYTRLADTLGLNGPAFRQCMQDEKSLARVDSDIAYAATVGVSGTPTFFVGRLDGDRLVDATKVVGAVSFESFSTTIDYLLNDG